MNLAPLLRWLSDRGLLEDPEVTLRLLVPLHSARQVLIQVRGREPGTRELIVACHRVASLALLEERAEELADQVRADLLCFALECAGAAARRSCSPASASRRRAPS